jgi:hypothetical protein
MSMEASTGRSRSRCFSIRRKRMTDDMLLAIPDWKELTDLELARAVTGAKRRGRQAAEMVAAQASEYDQPERLKRIANFDLYLNECVRPAGAGPDLIHDWGMKNAVEACDDPRLAWFCVVYQRTLWRLQGNGATRKPTLMVLQKIRDYQWQQVTRAQYAYSLRIAAIHQDGGSVGEPGNRMVLHHLQAQFVAQLDYAMLTVMTLNVATEEWLEGGPP